MKNQLRAMALTGLLFLKKMMQVLLNIYTRQRHLLTKKYFDKWRKSPEESLLYQP